MNQSSRLPKPSFGNSGKSLDNLVSLLLHWSASCWEHAAGRTCSAHSRTRLGLLLLQTSFPSRKTPPSTTNRHSMQPGRKHGYIIGVSYCVYHQHTSPSDHTALGSSLSLPLFPRGVGGSGTTVVRESEEQQQQAGVEN